MFVVSGSNVALVHRGPVLHAAGLGAYTWSLLRGLPILRCARSAAFPYDAVDVSTRMQCQCCLLRPASSACLLVRGRTLRGSSCGYAKYCSGCAHKGSIEEDEAEVRMMMSWALRPRNCGPRAAGAVVRILRCEAVNDSSSTFRLRGKERG